MDLPRLDPDPLMDPDNPLEINSVSTKPTIPIANDDETVSLLPAEQEVLAVWESSVDKVARPVGFKLGTGPFTAGVVARALIPKDWGNNLDCLLTGNIGQGNEAIKIFSGAWKWNIPQPRSDSPAEQFKFETDVEFLDPLGDSKLASILPYGFHGEVQWTLELKSPGKLTTIPKLAGGKATSLLEMYRLYGDAPGGPTAAAAVTRINLQGKWPIGLLRSFVPDPFEVAKLSADDVAALKTDLWSWWARHAVGKLQSKKQCYDAAEGRSGYGVGPTGGSFDLQGWIQDSNPNVNSADLTALLQAAFSILSTPQLPDPSNWVLMAPFGEIAANKVLPFGFDLDDGVKNPFFKGLGAKDPGSGGMSSFSWLEIKPNDSNPPTVVQTAFKIKGPTDGDGFKPDVAQRGRKAFLQSCISNPETLPNLGMENCFTTADFDPIKADNNGLYLRRVGLYDLRGINEPWQLIAYNRPSLMPMTKRSRFAIQTLLQAREGDEKIVLLNDASLLPSAILPKLTSDPKFKVTTENFNLKVGRGVAVASYTVPLGLRSPTGSDINACVKIHVYQNYNDALEAMAFELAKLESMPEKVVRSPSHIYGSYMIQTTKGLFMIRGNLMVNMTVLGLDQYDDTLAEALFKMAGQLYIYFIVRVALPFQARRPSVIVADEWKTSSKVVELRKPFDVAVQLKGEYIEKDTMCVYIASGDGTSSTEQPIIFTGISKPVFGSDRTFSFYSLNKENKNIPGEVHVTIGVAHSETFFPATATFTVKL
ncbi:hypothetical protein DER45DRAFT_649950 [Fusarium avenaceum]|nr:hypothetical protein DER45DRAFT_649950 [Fusarium avenaceum]